LYENWIERLTQTLRPGPLHGYAIARRILGEQVDHEAGAFNRRIRAIQLGRLSDGWALVPGLAAVLASYVPGRVASLVDPAETPGMA
jgi:hypothetical protein